MIARILAWLTANRAFAEIIGVALFGVVVSFAWHQHNVHQQAIGAEHERAAVKAALDQALARNAANEAQWQRQNEVNEDAHKQTIADIEAQYDAVLRDRWSKLQICAADLHPGPVRPDTGTGAVDGQSNPVGGNQPASAGSIIGEALKGCELDAADLHACKDYAALAFKACGLAPGATNN
jgi:hypothetical protein